MLTILPVLVYFGLIRADLSEARRKALQMHPQGMQFFDESQQQSFTRGRAAEKATDVLDILDTRGLAVSDAQRDRIIGCSDLEVLTSWIRRAITAASTDELFG